MFNANSSSFDVFSDFKTTRSESRSHAVPNGSSVPKTNAQMSKSGGASQATGPVTVVDPDPEEILDMYVGRQWRTSLGELRPELESSLRSFKERW